MGVSCVRNGLLCLLGCLFAIGAQAFGLDFSPAPIYENNRTFGSVSIGGIYQRVANMGGTLGDSRRGAVSFELKRGMTFLESRSLLLNAWLEGRAAGGLARDDLYGASVGAQVGYRLFSGRVIALFGGGFEMNTLAIPDTTKEQPNLYGGVVRAELFVDIAKGYGLSVSYGRGISERSKKLPNNRFSTDCVLIAFSYYDFSI